MSEIFFYPMIGLSSNIEKALFFSFTMFLWILMGLTCGLFFSFLSSNLQIGMMFSAIIVNLWNVLAGFFIPKSSLPSFWGAFYYIDPSMYVLQALVSTEFYCTNNCQSITFPYNDEVILVYQFRWLH